MSVKWGGLLSDVLLHSGWNLLNYVKMANNEEDSTDFTPRLKEKNYRPICRRS